MPEVEKKPLSADFDRKFKGLEDVFKQEIERAYTILQQSLVVVYPDAKPEDFSKWKRPGWWDTWQQQGLAGLGRRIFHGSNPHNDYLTWKMRNLPKSESAMSSLQEYLIIQETCSLLVNDLFEIDESVDERVVTAVRRFKHTMTDIFTVAIHQFYNLGRQYGVPPEEIGSKIGPESPLGPKTAEEPPEKVDTELEKPEELKPQEPETGNETPEPPESDFVQPDNVDDIGTEEDANTTAKEITIPEDILRKLPITDTHVEEILRDWEESEGQPFDDKGDRKLAALNLLADRIMSSVLESGEVEPNRSQLETLHAILIHKFGIAEDDLKRLNPTQSFALYKICEWLADPTSFNWMNPNLKRVEPANDDAIAAAAIKVRFETTHHNLFARLVKHGYKPWSWFKKASRTEWPKNSKAAEDKAKQRSGAKPAWVWPTQLHDKGPGAYEAMVDVCTAIKCGDLFGRGEVLQNPSNVNNKQMLNELTDGCYGTKEGKGHASIMTALVKTIRDRDKLENTDEVNNKILSEIANPAIEAHAKELHRSLEITSPPTVIDGASFKSVGQGSGKKHFHRTARTAELEEPEEG